MMNCEDILAYASKLRNLKTSVRPAPFPLKVEFTQWDYRLAIPASLVLVCVCVCMYVHVCVFSVSNHEVPK